MSSLISFRPACGATPPVSMPGRRTRWCPMKWWVTLVVFLALASAHGSGAARTPEPERDMRAGVRGVFAAKCAAATAPTSEAEGTVRLRPRPPAGGQQPEMVIPGRPDESELWVLVRHGDMPPADSPHGPLSAAEKEAIRAWIAAGAPDASPPPSGASGPTPGPEPTFTPDPAVASPVPRAVRWLGRFHLLLLHFPITLVLAAGVGEVASTWRGSRVPSPAVQFCLSLAAVAVVPTVALGWLHAAAGSGVGSPGLLSIHRWLGTAAGAWVIGTALCARRDATRGVRSGGCRVALAIGILLIAATAHVGGLTAHGRDFLDW